MKVHGPDDLRTELQDVSVFRMDVHVPSPPNPSEDHPVTNMALSRGRGFRTHYVTPSSCQILTMYSAVQFTCVWENHDERHRNAFNNLKEPE